MSTPFNENPWQSGGAGNGPRYGNAYESEPIPSNYAGGRNAYDQPVYNNNSQFSATGYNNAWGGGEGAPPPAAGESNKTLQQQSPYLGHQDAYQFTGTRYGNQASGGVNAYSAASPQPATNDSYQLGTKNTSTVIPDNDSTFPSQPYSNGAAEAYHTPNKWRFWFRFGILLASIGHLGFAAGARPVSLLFVCFSSRSNKLINDLYSILVRIFHFIHLQFYTIYTQW
jgi:hypothetical protein